ESRFATFALADSVMLANSDSLIKWHQEARDAADGEGNLGLFEERYEPGTARFDSLFNAITSANVFTEGGSGFYDKSTLTHIQGEYKFTPKPFSLLLGGSFRQYNPDSRGTIFLDTGNVTIRNREFGFYGSIEKRVLDSTLILTASGRIDKNENFDLLGSPAVSAVYLADKDNTFRLSFSSAIRNPTLQDQYLFYNAGRAILIGNLNGFENLVTVPSLFSAFSGTVVDMDSLVYFDVDPVRPEKVRTIEVGYKGTVMKNLWIDVSYYYSWYEDFLGFKVGADVTLDTNFNQITVDNIFRVTANSPDVVVTQGFSLGLNYYFGDYYALNGNYSWNKLDRRGSDDEIIPAFNTPEHKFNIGVSGRDIMGQLGPVRLRHWGFNVNYKWVDGFVFEGSPQFTGFVPSYGLLDAQVNKKVPSIKSVFKLGASNLLNNEVFQTVGGPFIGRMLYFSVLVELDNL
ncbi:MAG: TonB-dependent receptor, partial [Bacteroidota bacterium]